MESPSLCFLNECKKRHNINISQEFINPFTPSFWLTPNITHNFESIFSLSKTHISSYINNFECLSITANSVQLQNIDSFLLFFSQQSSLPNTHLFFLAFDFCRFCVVIRFFHPRHNGQWPPTSKDFLSQILSITFIFLS